MSNSAIKYRVLLTPQMRADLLAVARKSSAGVAKVRRARILLLADEADPAGSYSDEEIAEEVGLSTRQIVRIRQKFVKSGVAPTLERAVRSDAGTRKAIDGRAEARLVTIACSTPPEGRDHWTLQLLCDELTRLRVVKSVCRETVRQVLKKTNCDLGRPSVSALPKRIERGSSRGWKQSSTSIKRSTTKSTR
jgi:hypothetical protein